MSEEKTEQAAPDAEAQYQAYLLEVGRKDADRHVAENMLGGEIGEVYSPVRGFFMLNF